VSLPGADGFNSERLPLRSAACSSFPEPASGKCLHGGFARSREAMRRVAAITEGKIDRPYPGPAIVSERAEQRDPADDLVADDHFVLGWTSGRLQQQIGHGCARPAPSLTQA